MGEDENMDREPDERTDSCGDNESRIFFCDEIPYHECQWVKDDSIGPIFHSLKPILYCLSSDSRFEIVFDSFPEIREKEYTNDIKMSRHNSTFFESEFFLKHFVVFFLTLCQTDRPLRTCSIVHTSIIAKVLSHQSSSSILIGYDYFFFGQPQFQCGVSSFL